MASTLLLLRRQAGYKSSRDFAEKIGVPAPTYTRYESNPDKIPLRNAWAIADELGCSIDAVVGRCGFDDVMANRGQVQIEYDALSEEGRELMDDMREVVQLREQKKRDRRERRDGARYAALCVHYEVVMATETEREAPFEAFGELGDGEGYRQAFNEFLVKRAEAKRRQAGEQDSKKAIARDENTVARIMEAFDRIRDPAGALEE